MESNPIEEQWRIEVMKETDTCQVCSRPIEKNQIFAWPEHKGKAYAICCPVCLANFQKSPDRYISETDIGRLKEES
jgi:YHS domain-containing protein